MAKGNINPLAKWCKADYEERGRLHARKGAEKAPFPRDATSWQAKAYWAAYDAEKFLGVVDKAVGDMADALGVSKEELMGEARPVKIGAVVKVSTNLKPTGVKVPAQGVSDHYVHADTRAWPGAAAEHFRMLKASLYKEKSPGRQARLKSALTRLILRHAPPYP